MPSSYLRIFADDEGESHIEDVEIGFEEADFVPPAPPVLLSDPADATRYVFELVPPGWYGDWHPAPSRVLAVYLSGEGEIEASDREVRKIEAGTILLAEDTTGRGHITRVTGTDEVLVVIVELPD